MEAEDRINEVEDRMVEINESKREKKGIERNEDSLRDFYRFREQSTDSMQFLQATSGIFHRARTNNFTTCMEIQKTLNSQSNLEKEEWN